MKKIILIFITIGLAIFQHRPAHADCYTCFYYYRAIIDLRDGKKVAGYIVSSQEESDIKSMATLRDEIYLIKEIRVAKVAWYHNQRLPDRHKVIIVNEEDVVKLSKRDVVAMKEDRSVERIDGTGRSLHVPSKRFVNLLLNSKPVAIHSWGDYNVGTLISFNPKFNEDELKKFESETLLYNPDKEKDKIKFFSDNDIFYYVESGD